MGRTLLLLAFVAAVAATAAYLAQRPTIARGDVIARDLLAQNRGKLTALACDAEVPIGIDGARFWCTATTSAGTQRVELELARTGAIREVDAGPVQKSDPWR